MLYYTGRQRVVDAIGLPVINAKTSFYVTGTDTPAIVYTDAALTIAHTQPIRSNSAGFLPPIYLDPAVTYKSVTTDENDVTLPDGVVDPLIQSSITQDYVGATLYPRTTAEIAAGVTPVNYFRPECDILRYGTNTTPGTTDMTTAIQAARDVAAAGSGYIVHPGGNIMHASQILMGNNITVRGYDRTACIFTYTGAAGSSAWRVTNNGTANTTANTSGFGRVYFENVTITTAVGASTAAALEINACGFAFYGVKSSTLGGTFKYGLIIDGCEVMHIQSNIIQNAGPANSANIWIVNGADRSTAANTSNAQNQAAGFSNAITIDGENQINGGTYGIADDGGSNHYIERNNVNGNQLPIRIAGVEGGSIMGLEIENALGGAATGEANIDFLTTGLGGVSVGGCSAVSVRDNFCGADMAAGGAAIKFGGAAFHYGVDIEGNEFRNNLGQTALIDQTKLGNSRIGPMKADTAYTGAIYTGVHNDANGNTFWVPQNGHTAAFSEAAYVHGDTRYTHQFNGGVDAKTNGVTNGLSLDAQKWQNFTLRLINTAGTIQHAIFDNPLQGAAPGYADRVTGHSTSLANTPSVAAGVGFTNGAGLLSGTTSHVVLDTAAATLGNANLTANIEYYDGNVTRCRVYIGLASRNVNGVTIARPELVFTNDMTGAVVNIDTTLLPAGKFMDINISGFFP